MSGISIHKVQIYYEDTDFSGVVYYANYLKFFERAREHVIGAEKLARLWEAEGNGMVVYKVAVTYHDGAQFGEVCEVRTQVRAEGDYRTIWQQELWRPGGTKAAVVATIELVCIDGKKNLIPTPPPVLAACQ